MLIKNWMTKDVVTITQDVSMMKASKILKDNAIRRLPVVDESNKVIGIVSDRDIKEASPSKATTLDVHELYYLLSEIKVRDIMTPHPFLIHEEATIEQAAAIMLEKRVGGLPVVDESDKIVGIVTDADVFSSLIAVTGIQHGGVQLGFKLSNEPGSLKVVLDELRSHKARVISILTANEMEGKGFRQVYIRIKDMDKEEEKTLRAELEKKYDLLYWVRDTMHPTSLQ